jgi:hypothetical protein
MRGRLVGRTRKDTARQETYRTELLVSLNTDGTYEITQNGALVATHIPEEWLDDELCSKRGFCGEELASIKRQLEEHSRAEMIV